MPNLIVSAVSTFDNKGLKKGKKEISAFDKNVQSLGKTFAKVFGTLAVANFAKNAVNAFIESEKAAAKLRTTVSNLGLAFEQQGIENYLDKLSLQFGILDENLMDALINLRNSIDSNRLIASIIVDHFGANRLLFAYDVTSKNFYWHEL